MNNNETFMVLKYTKQFILSIDNYIDNFPNKERNLKERILNESFSIYNLICLANLITEEKRKTQYKIIAKINVLDLCFEKAFKKKYLSEKQFNKVTNELTRVSKLVFGWIKNE